MVKIANTLNIEPFELFKPAGVSLPTVTALFPRYNDEAAEAVSASLKQVYGYFQEHLTEGLTAAEEGEGM
jgi:hypothetical protein